MGEKPKRGLTEEQWAEVRVLYEQGASIAALSKRFGARWNTIDDRRKREGWTVEPTVEVNGPRIRREAQAKVIDIATGKALEQSGVVEAVVDEIKSTSKATKLAAEYMVDVLERAKDGKLELGAESHQTEADIALKVMGAYSTFVKTLRENAGLRLGQPTAPAEGRADRRFEFTVDEDALAEARRLAEAG